MILVYKEVSKKLLAFIYESPFCSVRDSGCLLIAGANNFSVDGGISTNVIKIAQFALDVLGGSLYCLKTFSEEIGLVSDVLAPVFIMNWEHSMEATIDDAFDESKEKIKGRSEISKSMHRFHSKINDKFWKSLSIDILNRLGSILVQFIRSVVFKEGKLNANSITSLCCKWMLEVLDCLCCDQYEEQYLLDQLLRKEDTWPSWIVPDFIAQEGSSSLNTIDVSTDIIAYGTHKFVSLIDKLIFKIGLDRVFAVYVEHNPSSPSNKPTNEELTARAWLAAEILCTWEWPGGSATTSFLPLLSAFSKTLNYISQESLLDSIFSILLGGALVHGESGTYCSFNLWSAIGDELDKIKEPFLRALLSLLNTLFKDHVWEGNKAMKLFELLVNKLYIGEAINQNCLKILPLIVSILVQPLCRRSIVPGESSGDVELNNSGENWIRDTIKDWLQRILLFPPIVSWQTGQDMEEWFQLVIACYPFSAMGSTKSLKLERDISLEERELILDLFRKQRHNASVLAAGNQLQMAQMVLSKLMVISVGYCGKDFTEEDWEFFFLQLRSWIQSAVVIMEEVAENVNDLITDNSSSEISDVLRNLEQLVWISDLGPINVAINALASFSLFCGVLRHQQPDMNPNPLRLERWNPVRDRILEGILRLFFCTGIAEAIASSYCHEAASITATSRLDNPYFWELVASNVINSSPHVRDRAVKSVEFWGLGKGPISSLYAILFSSIPVPPLQFAAYVILSTEPVSQLAIIEEDAACSLDGILVATWIHVNVFLAWSLLLSHLWSLPSLSAAREQLVQYVQDSANSVILDCLFQHIPLELCMAQSLKKKDVDLPAGASEVASAATSAITTGSLLFSVESLWPIAPEKMASLAGALFGLMLRVLPAYVRGWFTDLHDRSTSSLIEAFTRTWCSPPLIMNELSQIKQFNFADENFSVSVSKSANEVVATYTKDETGMDLVIRLPASYPLRPVDVDCMRSLGISEVKQRKWLMSMMLFVRNQNGALAEAIRIWKSNFDKEFEGVEECPICYSVIHTANHSLPRLACRTCKHKFHAACLYKWFSTSHKSSCPLCQSPF
ncbi:hypothetical protein GH714_010633 [Hevea brasiliensis]|uniref:E3 ubiquitin-protein ligase listerin n=1 Tax=Hevea brasiliensis TaxID=3981 RepID=A0A6A6L673_HEVBR|nr:hypothetical protein GH714_010633 [Hevea brasiliensis]